MEEQQEQPLVGAKASELANYIFTTPELLMLILTHLSGADLLRVASISSSFHENIKRSPALQRNLNFIPSILGRLFFRYRYYVHGWLHQELEIRRWCFAHRHLPDGQGGDTLPVPHFCEESAQDFG